MGHSGNIRVYVRIRPAFKDEETTLEAGEKVLEVLGNGRIAVTPEHHNGRSLRFDGVFRPETTQREVFNSAAQEIVDSVLQGESGAVLVYGQTGSGKTHTMGLVGRVLEVPEEVKTQPMSILPAIRRDGFIAPDAGSGVVARALARMFHKRTTSVKLSFLQIYNDVVTDLLAEKVTSERGLLIRQDSQGFFVDGLCTCKVNTLSEAVSLVNTGLAHRVVASTQMNRTSSRSHTILLLTLPEHNPPASLALVDLAGSERIKRSCSDGTRLAEARSINQSLSALGNVISALAHNSRRHDDEEPQTARHVPFRDSALTKILARCLVGGARTCLIATVSPELGSVSETLSTLLFAARCRDVSTETLVAPVQSPTNDIDANSVAEALLSKARTELSKFSGSNGCTLVDVANELGLSMRELNGLLAQHLAGMITAQTVQNDLDASINQSLENIKERLESPTDIPTCVSEAVRLLQQTAANTETSVLNVLKPAAIREGGTTGQGSQSSTQKTPLQRLYSGMQSSVASMAQVLRLDRQRQRQNKQTRQIINTLLQLDNPRSLPLSGTAARQRQKAQGMLDSLFSFPDPPPLSMTLPMLHEFSSQASLISYLESTIDTNTALIRYLHSLLVQKDAVTGLCTEALQKLAAQRYHDLEACGETIRRMHIELERLRGELDTPELAFDSDAINADFGMGAKMFSSESEE